MRLGAAFACAVMLICIGVAPGHADKRVALVIGNGAYTKAPRLPNPRNDAEDVAAAFRRSGFETIVGLDLDKAGMDDIAIRFSRASRDSDVAIFYYSGHALQFAGINYLMPIDANLTDEADLRRMTRVDETVADLQQARNVRILVLDACRDNPLAEDLKRSIGLTRSASLQRGLARIDAPQGMIVAYATQAGRTAADGTDRNSPYTAAFLRHIEAQVEIGTVFRRVSAEVYEATKHSQLPELSLSLIGEFYLRGKPSVVGQTPDEIAWSLMKGTSDAKLIEALILRFPMSLLRPEWEARLAAVSAEASPPPPPPDLQLGNAGAPRVVLYEEDPGDPKGKRFVGTAVWRTEAVPPRPGGAPELAVRADVEIPERQMKMTWSLRRNTDKALPASHTIELMFSLPSDFPSGGVAEVHGILMKKAEQVSGVPLSGLGVKVTNNFFLIGLSSNEDEMKRNSELLKDWGWVDVPIIYTNGRRAILALEKGVPGERAVNEAFAAWGPPPSPTSSLGPPAVGPLAAPYVPPGPNARSGWAIQVGVYDGEAEARNRLSSVQDLAKDLLAAATPFVDRVQSGDRTFYRARFTGLDKEHADAACEHLKRTVACMTIKN
ncbi:MAG: caspase family protein [Xanthobacteraceae bacterium]